MKPRRIDPANKPGPKPVPFAWLDCRGTEIVLAMDNDQVVVEAPDYVIVSASPALKPAHEARKQAVDEQWPVIGVAGVFVSRCGKCQRIVIETNQMSLCRGDIEQAIVEWVARRDGRRTMNR